MAVLSARILSAAAMIAVLSIVLGGQAAGSAKPPANSHSFGAITSTLQAKLNEQSYVDGLKTAEEGLALFPGDPNLTYGKALCFIGLFRSREALQELAPLAQNHIERPDFALTLGEAQCYAGDDRAALNTLSGLCANRNMAGKAYALSVKILIASGREEEARKFIEDASTKLPTASAELIRYKLDLVRKASEALPLLDQLVTIDPQNAPTYEALRMLYQAGGDKAFNEMQPVMGQPPEDIPLARTFNPREGTATEFNTEMGGGMTASSSFPAPVLTAQASINGAPQEKMMFDSGSPIVFVSYQLAQRLSLKPLSRVRSLGLGRVGVIENSWTLLDTIQVGKAIFHQVPAIIASPKTTLWGEFSGIIPLSLFKHEAVIYDPSGPSLKIMATGTCPEQVLGAGSFEVKSAWFKGCPFARASVQDLGSLFCLLDTGSFSTFLAPDVVPGLYARPESIEWRMTLRKTGISGGFEPMIARQIRLCLGERCATLSEVQVAPMLIPYGVPCAGIIGRNILDQYMVFLDYGSNRAYFKRREK